MDIPGLGWVGCGMQDKKMKKVKIAPSNRRKKNRTDTVVGREK